MAKPDLDAIRARCEAATIGEWVSNKFGGYHHTYKGPIKVKGISMSHDGEICEMEYAGISDKTKKEINANALFIAYSRTDIPELLDYIKDLHQQIHTLEKSLDSNFKGELVAKARLQAVNFSIDNNGCGGELTNDDWCKFCFMRPYCEERKS